MEEEKKSHYPIRQRPSSVVNQRISAPNRAEDFYQNNRIAVANRFDDFH